MRLLHHGGLLGSEDLLDRRSLLGGEDRLDRRSLLGSNRGLGDERLLGHRYGVRRGLFRLRFLCGGHDGHTLGNRTGVRDRSVLGDRTRAAHRHVLGHRSDRALGGDTGVRHELRLGALLVDLGLRRLLRLLRRLTGERGLDALGQLARLVDPGVPGGLGADVGERRRGLPREHLALHLPGGPGLGRLSQARSGTGTRGDGGGRTRLGCDDPGVQSRGDATAHRDRSLQLSRLLRGFTVRFGNRNNRFRCLRPRAHRRLDAPRGRALRGQVPELRCVEVLGAGRHRARLPHRRARGATVGEGADRARGGVGEGRAEVQRTARRDGRGRRCGMPDGAQIDGTAVTPVRLVRAGLVHDGFLRSGLVDGGLVRTRLGYGGLRHGGLLRNRLLRGGLVRGAVVRDTLVRDLLRRHLLLRSRRVDCLDDGLGSGRRDLVAPGALGARQQQKVFVLGGGLGEVGVRAVRGNARLFHHACVLRQPLGRDLAGVGHAYPSPIG